MERKAHIVRRTTETDISVHLFLNGQGKADVSTGIGFMDHMLCLFALHGGIDLEVKAKGDLHVDQHHLVEDLGISIGMAIKEVLGDRAGIQRYGEATIPMDEALVRVALDLSNRPFLFYTVPEIPSLMGGFDIRLVKEFFRALVNNAGITAHIDGIRGEDPHHIVEAVFKAFARAFKVAAQMGSGSIPSTKGIL